MAKLTKHDLEIALQLIGTASPGNDGALQERLARFKAAVDAVSEVKDKHGVAPDE